MSHPSLKYLRQDRLPTIYCPGCGVGIVLNATLKAIEKSGLDFDKFVFVSGIGCSGRTVNYINADTFHTTHGRAIPVAEGIKLARPDLRVVVFTGDGDAGAIGGNHLIHAARRNIDITAICINNMIYGLTGGQVSPTTPVGARTETSYYGNFEGFFDLSRLVAASGANYVARWTTYHINQLSAAIGVALKSEGFSFVEALSQCPVEFGRKNKMRTIELLNWFKDNSFPVGGAAEDPGKMAIGEFANRNNPSFITEYKKLTSEARGGRARPLGVRPRLSRQAKRPLGAQANWSLGVRDFPAGKSNARRHSARFRPLGAQARPLGGRDMPELHWGILKLKGRTGVGDE